VSEGARASLATTIIAALCAGGAVGAGVGLHWYSPAVAVALAVLIGLTAGYRVFRTARMVKRGAGHRKT
jgi:hypothetical protein